MKQQTNFRNCSLHCSLPQSTCNHVQDACTHAWMRHLLKMNAADCRLRDDFRFACFLHSPGTCTNGQKHEITEHQSQCKNTKIDYEFDTLREFLRDIRAGKVINYYFRPETCCVTCPTCEGSGYGPTAEKLYSTFCSGCEGDPSSWGDKLDEDDLNCLITAGRCVSGVSVDAVNKANSRYSSYDCELIHDETDKAILIANRCRRLGVKTSCESCDGLGYLVTYLKGHMDLLLLWLNFESGRTSTVKIRNIKRHDLPGILRFLRDADRRDRKRFAGIRRCYVFRLLLWLKEKLALL